MPLIGQFNLSLNNSRFDNCVDRIYPIELEIKDTTYTDRSASYLDLRIEIVNFPFICMSIQQHLYMEYISLS
jgi:hypothetical protein